MLDVGAKWTIILITFSSDFIFFFRFFYFFDLLSVKLVLEHFVDSCLFEARMTFTILLTRHVNLVCVHIAPNTLDILLNRFVGSTS